MTYIHYGEIMRTRRKKLGISQRELAERIPMSFQQISKIESDSLDKALNKYNLILRELGLKIAIIEENDYRKAEK